MIYIDVGYFVGNALKIYQDKGIVDDSWTIYAFEPNPEIEVPDWVIRKAAWIKDGSVKFQIGKGRNDAASIEGMAGHEEPKIITVPCFDFSAFLSGLPNEFTICSMDPEGAEFDLLEKMIEDGTIDKIDILDIEFHHRLLDGRKNSDDAQELINKVITRTAVRLKVPLV